jgi:hypothetical protein
LLCFSSLLLSSSFPLRSLSLSFQATFDKGVSWQLLTDQAPWTPRTDSRLVLFNDFVFVIGGKGSNAATRDDASKIWKWQPFTPRMGFILLFCFLLSFFVCFVIGVSNSSSSSYRLFLSLSLFSNLLSCSSQSPLRSTSAICLTRSPSCLCPPYPLPLAPGTATLLPSIAARSSLRAAPCTRACPLHRGCTHKTSGNGTEVRLSLFVCVPVFTFSYSLLFLLFPVLCFCFLLILSFASPSSSPSSLQL